MKLSTFTLFKPVSNYLFMLQIFLALIRTINFLLTRGEWFVTKPAIEHRCIIPYESQAMVNKPGTLVYIATILIFLYFGVQKLHFASGYNPTKPAKGHFFYHENRSILLGIYGGDGQPVAPITLCPSG